MGFGVPLISFRFHLVSLTAIFLALALGIVLGTTVVERATVSVLESRIKSVRTDAAHARAERDILADRLGKADRFNTELESQVLAGRLDGVRVLIVTADGVPGNVADALRTDLNAAGAVNAGAISLSDEWNTGDAKARHAMVTAAGVANGSSAEIRQRAADKLAAELAVGGGPTLRGLVEAGFARSSVVEVETVPGPDTRFVILGNTPGNLFAEPLARALGVAAAARVVAAEMGPELDAKLVLVAALREQRGPAKLSTVDHVDTPAGRVATTLALAALGRGVTGDFGTAPGADRTVPAAA